MKRYPVLLSVAFFTCAALTAPVMATAEVVANLTARKVVTTAGGSQSYQPADKASPGDVIEYQALYTNQGTSPVKNLIPTMPVPAGMEYIPGSAKPAQVMASLDGKNFEAVPLKRKVTLPSGKQEVRDVPYEEYRFVRWNAGDMAAGSSTMVSARTRVSDTGAIQLTGQLTSATDGNASVAPTAKKGGKS